MSMEFKENVSKIPQQSEKNSKLFQDKIILYNEEAIKDDFFAVMRQGYLEMAEINLKIAKESEGEFADVNDYETWLCGV